MQEHIMNVSELFNLTHWITQEIEGVEIPQKYEALQRIVQQHASNNPQQPFESEKENLFQALKGVPLAQLTRDQIDFLENLGIAKAVGEDGVSVIEDVLYKNVIDVATSAQKIKQILEKIIEGITKSNQIKIGLSDCVLDEEYETDDEILMRVSFTDQASMKNIKDFKRWGTIWYDIGRGIAMAHGLAPEDVKVVGATKGSMIFEFAVFAMIAKTASSIIIDVLKVAEKIIDIQKKIEELRQLKLPNEKVVVKELEEAAEIERKGGVEKITNNIVNKLDINKSNEGDKIKALTLSVKHLVDFTKKGGAVDFIAPEEEHDDEEGHDEDRDDKYADLRVAFQEIRQLEKKLKLIEHQKYPKK